MAFPAYHATVPVQSSPLQSVSRASSHGRRPPILERNLVKGRSNEVSLSAYAFLFCEMLSYATKKSSGIQDMEKKLSDFGYRVGIRSLELLVFRDRPNRRDTRLLNTLSFIHTNVWKTLFGRAADSLEKGTDNEDEYMISDNEPNVTKFIAVPKEMNQLSCGAFIGGIVEAVLDGCGFPAKVSAHSTGSDQFPLRTTILMKFDKSVLLREKGFEPR
ncbi:TRAPP subunit trs31 [Geranomyces variabilis]|nr:NO signaling/Golgi transport ligand-binding domain-containing protein [Geranomyces variabilis]KAJ3143406.1 TRAPP subunit trs31 [Geranomyces variabilis]KAJ3157054.1 TRAPP subunit trs31 [Geranomyces variabilis]